MPIDSELPRFVRDLLHSPPSRGGGLNIWLYRTARVLHPFRDDAEIIQLLSAATAGEPVKHGEIERAVQRSAATAWQPGQPSAVPVQQPAWPTVNTEQREAIIGSGVGLVDLWEASPLKPADDTDAVIDLLFPGNPLLCVGRSNSEFATRSREKWRGRLAEMPHIVPSPMSSQTGLTQDGEVSEHSLNNTGPRKFLVIEQDEGSPDDQAAVLLHLAKRAPLVVAAHSGGKSIHGWFKAEGQGEDRLKRFMRYAVSLGADRAMWTRSQFTRLPGGTHQNGNQQVIYFLNAEALG